MVRTRLGQLMALVTLVSVVACGAQPARAPAQPGAGVPVGQTEGPKSLTLAIQAEPKGFVAELSLENVRAGGVKQVKPIAHNLLTAENDKGEWIAELAASAVTVENGSWQVHDDGTMDLTWRIRPNVKWHDGTPFTSDDLVFSWQVFTDPEIANTVGSRARFMSSVEAPDPHTFVIHWAKIVVSADQAPGLNPLPRHLLTEAFQTDKANFAASPYLSTQFVGLGPYRLTNWDRGSGMEFSRFDGYWRGRPPLDRVFVRFLGSPDTMIANILAGSVDVVLPPAVDLETAIRMRERWEGTPNRVLLGPGAGVRLLDTQLRPDLARPVNGFVQIAVRQAFYEAIDRPTLADALNGGLAPIAESWYTPDDPRMPQLESAIPRYPYDPRQAERRLTQAGWVIGPDRVLVNQQTGDPFAVQLDGTNQQRVMHELSIIADNWKLIGAQPSIYTIPAELGNDVQHRATQSGAGVRIRNVDSFQVNYLATSDIPGPQNRWTGSNYGGYSNPRVDALLDRLGVTVDPNQRIPIQRELLSIIMGDLPIWPIYWDMTNVLVGPGVTGLPNASGTYQTWNFFEWSKAAV